MIPGIDYPSNQVLKNYRRDTSITNCSTITTGSPTLTITISYNLSCIIFFHDIQLQGSCVVIVEVVNQVDQGEGFWWLQYSQGRSETKIKHSHILQERVSQWDEQLCKKKKKVNRPWLRYLNLMFWEDLRKETVEILY